MPLTAEQIAEALKSPELKEAIKTAVDGEVKGLKNKNTELLGKLNAEKDAKSETEKRLNALEADKTKAEEDAATASGDVNKMREQLETRHKKELDERDGKIKNLDGQLNTHVLDQGLTASLTKANVAPGLMPAAKALIKAEFKGEIGDNDGTPFAKFDGQAVGDFVTNWAGTDAGKHFVTADKNSGGGSNGANGKGDANSGAKTITRSAFSELSHAERSKSSIAGVQVVND